MSRQSESVRSAWPVPVRPGIAAKAAYRLHAVLARNALWAAVARLIERHPILARLFTRAERASKEALFGCRMCGQCALPDTGYACPMTCPKQLRNGPCGGVSPTGMCEVHPEERCVWVIAYERSAAAGHGGDLDLLQRPVDHREFGTSSWVNYWQGRDEDLAVAPAAPGAPRPLLHRQLGLVPR